MHRCYTADDSAESPIPAIRSVRSDLNDPIRAIRWYPRISSVTAMCAQPAIREKAVAIANALLTEGYPEAQAIRIAIAQAQRWARRRLLSRSLVGER